MNKWIILPESPEKITRKEFNILVDLFIEKFCTKVIKNEPIRYVELQMDDHICIKWKTSQYYVPKNNSFYSQTDDFIYDYLANNYQTT